jgi:Tfp pilus assembly protein PilF/TolB-like protein
VPADAEDVAAVGARRLAVLAFTSPAGDRATHELAAAIGERISYRLRAIRPLEVIARDSRGSVAASLNGRSGADARYLLAGSLDRRGSSVVLELRLLEGATGRVAWRGRITRAGNALYDLEGAAATAAANHTLRELTSEELAILTARPTTNSTAYHHFLRGTYLLGEPAPASLSRAIHELDQAWRADPSFASAWSELALGYGIWLHREAVAGRALDTTVLVGALAAADRALALDSRSSSAWVARAVLLERRSPRALTGVREAYDRALALDPSDEEAHRRLGFLLAQLGEFNAAGAHLRTALLLEPESARTLTDLAELRMMQGNSSEACTLLNAALEANPNALDAYVLRVQARLPLREFREAWADAETATRLGSPVLGEAAAVLVDVAARDTAAGHARLRRLLARPALRDDRTFGVREGRLLAMACTAAGERDRAIEILHRVRPRGVALWRALQSPELHAISSDSRIVRLTAMVRPQPDDGL